MTPGREDTWAVALASADGIKYQVLKTLCIHTHTDARCDLVTVEIFPHFLTPCSLFCFHTSVETVFSSLTKTPEPIFCPNPRNLSFVFSIRDPLFSSWNPFLFCFSVTVLSWCPRPFSFAAASCPFPLFLKCGIPPGQAPPQLPAGCLPSAL